MCLTPEMCCKPLKDQLIHIDGNLTNSSGRKSRPLKSRDALDLCTVLVGLLIGSPTYFPAYFCIDKVCHLQESPRLHSPAGLGAAKAKNREERKGGARYTAILKQSQRIKQYVGLWTAQHRAVASGYRSTGHRVCTANEHPLFLAFSNSLYTRMGQLLHEHS